MNYYSQFIDMAHAYKIPIYFYGIGIGPFKEKAAEEYAITLLRKGEMIAVRDPNSFQFVKKHIDNEKISLITDPAMCLKAVPPERRKQILKKEKLPSNYKLVGICLRPWFFKGKKEQELLKKIGQVGEELYKQYNVRFVLIPFSQYQGDITLMKRVKQYLPKGSSYFINPKNKSSKYIQGLCSSLSLMIGMRLHSLILAASQNVPVIGLSYDPKVNHFMRSIKQEQFLFSYNTVTNKQLLESAQLILNGDINKENYISTIQNMKQKCLAKLSEA
ncbi:polysaccharide pyruvyl transferase family protein [Pontibacillus sp. HMF3514]|uniref:polysaccharide pyruvyl transferase family protein n=1 Tax=Pontibacillus sp. HMF3514 TaxID=2692425 RepID=UPI00131FE37A|nr:polysaccharide pyruvyl transferase family protein [Pontibacillus sp. HMF3514]QHE54110.1 hypothetical protein GS400_19710 [Pontibacillus sp. HMF3514]